MAANGKSVSLVTRREIEIVAEGHLGGWVG